MNKSDLRIIYQAKRKNLSDAEIEFLSLQTCEKFFQEVELAGVSNLHVFLPIARQKEINTWLIIQKLREDFKEISIVVSRTNWGEKRMDHFYLNDQTRLTESILGIPEPEEGESCPAVKIDLILLPLLAFDLSGNRVGYGAGFYDRFLSSCLPHTRKIGLSLFEATPELISDVNEHDVPMDACICPNKAYFFDQKQK